MRWFAPPTRRELSLLLFCATVFMLAFNFENILYVGYPTQNVLPSKARYTSNIIEDGRKSSEWRDRLDDFITGNYDWKNGEALDANLDQGQPLGIGPHSAMWIGKNEQNRLWPPANEPGISAGFWRWNNNVPKTKLVKHSPGYTVLDQVVILNNIVYIVTDEPESFPSVSSITNDHWEVISSDVARYMIGKYGGVIDGVSWMCTEPLPQNTTLLALWALYSSLDVDVMSLPFPKRLILPQTPVFEDSDLDENYNKKLNLASRPRSSTGFHPFLAKVAFPQMSITYREDWADYMEMEVPYVIQRLVIADYDVAGPDGLSAALQQTSRNWWEPVRQSLAAFFQEPEDSERKSVTYVYRPDAMETEDRNSLLRALNKMSEDQGVSVYLVEAVDRENGMKWGERLAAVVRSDVILSVQGPDILDGVFLKPSSKTTMIEFFSPNTASPEHESIAKALGFQYIAWSYNRKLSSDEISQLYNSRSHEQGLEVSVDVNAVVEAILDVLNR